MAKYDFDDTGSSCHIHSSLWSPDGRTPLFDDHDAPFGMSETFRHFLAGQIVGKLWMVLLALPFIHWIRRRELARLAA